MDRAGVAPLGEKIFLCLLRGRKVVAADDGHRLPVEFLGIGAVDIPRAQPGLHMPHRDAQIIGRERGGKGGRRVALHEDDVRLFRFQHALEPFENAGCYVKERLRILHNGEIVVRHDGKRCKDLVEHLAVLSRDADNGFYFAPCAQLLHERAHFHGLRPRAENQQDLFHGVPFLLRAGCLCLSEDPALGLKDLGVLPSDLHAVAHGQCADILAGGINAPAL